MQSRNSRAFGGLIWTDHALKRLEERKLSQDLASAAFRAPDAKEPGRQPGSIEYRKRVGASTITLIVTRNQRNEPVVISAWIDPPLPGTADAYRQERWRRFRTAYNRAGLWGKLFLSIKRAIVGI